jgi:hypothetical protein
MARSISLACAIVAASIFATAIPGIAEEASSPNSDQQSSWPMGPNGMMGHMGPGMMGGMMGYGGGYPMMGPNAMMARQPMGPGMMMDVGPAMEGQLAYIKAEIGVTDAEQPAWDGYANAVKARTSTMRDIHQAMWKAMQTGSAIERLEARTQAMQSMVDSMKAIKPALETLYNGLSEDQKRKADLLLGSGCCMM